MKKIYYLFVVCCLLFSFNSNAQNIDSSLTTQEEESMTFLKTYMPLSDIADYNEAFFLTQVRSSLKAKEYFSWGKIIPEDIFRHFVLVYRVNNENLDSSRVVFFNLLKDRIKNMSMYDAALEVNHWCHQYVNYKGADGRTSSPLATLKTSYGRCGEESTFLVSALRSVSIPARQCYTPRWAHTDDNHAWVEVWVEGKWYFLGACEPDVELNMGWFAAPAKRAMMVHTTVFGANYKGDEEVNYQTNLYSKINLLPNYAPTKKIYVEVKDKEGNLVKDANVAFGLYNYAEYYPLAERNTDNNGLTFLTTGFGDLMIWANKGTGYAYKKITVKEVDTIYLSLKPNKNRDYEELLEIVPPIQRAVTNINRDKAENNSKRLLFEDSIRNAYIATFPNDSQIKEFSNKLPNFDSKDIEDVIKKSCGNYKEIEDFLEKNKNTPEAMIILNVIYEKDLRDTPKEILQSHLDTYLKTKNENSYSKEITDNYILNPRIQLELITPWREYIYNNKLEIFSDEEIKTPLQISTWINNNIELNTKDNYYNCQISPKGVLKLKQTDIVSREILFVAIARTFGIPAKYDWATGKAEYYNNNEWLVAFTEDKTGNSISNNNDKCILNVNNNTVSNKIKPEYYSHFTLAKFTDGKFVTLDYEYDPKFKQFPEKLVLDPGYYRLLTGNRANDGTVYVKTNYFELKPNTTSDIFVELREIPQALVSEGMLKLTTKITLTNKQKTTLSKLSEEKGMVLAILDPEREPTRHVMVDIPLLKQEFEQWGGGMLFLVPDEKLAPNFDEKNYKGLPSQSLFAIDKGGKIFKQILKATNKDIKDNFPILLLITKKGEIVFLSEGYRIGAGENLIKTIYQLETK